MITGITIENFKGIRKPVKLDFRPITLLFGANSAGKSTVMHALHYAREIFERHNLDADKTIAGGPYVDLGGFRNFIHRGTPDRSATDELSEGDDRGYGGTGDGSGSGVGTAYGEGFADGSGYGDRLGVSASDREVRIGITLALSEADLPEYRQAEDYNLYDEMESLYVGIKEVRVEVLISWSDHLHAPHVTEYSISYNGILLAKITSQPGRRMPVLETVDVNHPILTKRKDLERFTKWESWSPDEVDDGNYSGLLYLLNKVRRNAWVPVWEDDTVRILETLAKQEDALPVWGNRLPLNDWRDDGVSGQPLDPPDREELESDNREINAVLSRLIVGPGEMVRDALRQFRYLGPLRDTPPRDFSPPRYPDPARWATGLGAWDSLYTGSDEFVDAVSDWLAGKDNLNSGSRVERRTYLELDYGDPIVRALMARRAFDDIDEHIGSHLAEAPTTTRVVVVPGNSDIELRPHDVGIGISQVVPVIVTALDGQERLLAIEQPELHIHPRLQAAIADLFVEAIGKKKHRFIIETHSEHLILRLLRRIRETEIDKAPANRQLRTDELAIYYLKQDNGSSRELRIDVDVKGEFIQPWPDDFFEIDFFERFPDAR